MTLTQRLRRSTLLAFDGSQTRTAEVQVRMAACVDQSRTEQQQRGAKSHSAANLRSEELTSRSCATTPKFQTVLSDSASVDNLAMASLCTVHR